AAKLVTVEDDLSSLGASGTTIKWKLIAPEPALGTRADAPETDPRITYQPDNPGKALATGYLWIESGTGIAVRRITGLEYDAIVMSLPATDGLPAPYTVERFKTLAAIATDVTRSQSQFLALNAPPPVGARAFHVLQLNNPAVTPGTAILTGATY